MRPVWLVLAPVVSLLQRLARTDYMHGRLRVRMLLPVSLAALLAAALALTLALQPAQAATPYVVTNCTSQGLVDAMNFMDAGPITDGLITFNCGGSHAPATIGINQSGGFNVTTGAAYTIDGGNSITLTGLNTTRLLMVQSGAALTLANILLTDGYADVANGGNGGAVYVDGGALVLNHATIQNSHTNVLAGGAIFANLGTVIVRNNSAVQGNYGYDYGAINSTGAVTIVDSILQGNQATTGGGALSVGGTVSIRSSQLLDNGATNAGKGGALFVTDLGRVTIADSTINHNGFGFGAGQAAGYGGGIYNMGALTVSNTIFNGNYAISQGGGIYNFGGLNEVTQGTLSVNGSTLSANQAANGGGIYQAGGSTTLNNSTLIGNSAVVYGGGIYIKAFPVPLNNSTLSGNSAGASGGGIFIDSYGSAKLHNSLLSGNSTAQSGGGIYINFGDATLDDSTLSGNSAVNAGGAFYTAGGLVSVNNSTLSSNTSGTDGGGIANDVQSYTTLDNSTLSGNSAARYGGGIYIYSSTLRLANSTVSGNSAQQQGGGLYNSMSDGRFHDASLLNVTLSNNAALSGGALFLVPGHRTALTNTILAYSSAGGNCAGTITSSKFTFSSDNSCALPPGDTIKGQNPNGLDPLLTALGNYGGPTLVHMTKSGSAARGGIIGNDAPTTDQRGLPRPAADGSYDIGAVEYQQGESTLAPWLYLPLLTR